MNVFKRERPIAEDKEPEEFHWLDKRLCYVRKHALKEVKEVARGFYPDGKIMFEYPMRYRQLNDTGVMFYPDGKKKKEETYAAGHLDGVTREWDESGQLRKRETFVGGIRHGLSIEWDVAGKFFRQQLFLRQGAVPEGFNQSIEHQPINADHVIRAENAEIRRILLRELGYERLLAQVDHQVLNKEGEQSLVRIDLSALEESIVLVKVKCPSTGAFYVLRVPPDMRTVRQAVAWTFDVSEEEYHPVQES